MSSRGGVGGSRRRSDNYVTRRVVAHFESYEVAYTILRMEIGWHGRE